jgi:hypothetical protein
MTDEIVETPIQTPQPEVAPKKKKRGWGCAVVVIILLVIVYTQITFFAVQPIGAIPDGVTLVMLRGQNTKFFDSADAMCMRFNDGVSLLCRVSALNAVAENATILMRLPYIDSIYYISTGGTRFER